MRWCTDDVVLSMSPNIVIPAPELSLLSRPSPHTPRAHRKDSGRLPSEKEREKVKELKYFILKNNNRPQIIGS